MHASSSLLHQSVDRAARIVALDLLEEAAKQRGRLGNKRNTEALHDFRVAVRRLRSWLRAFDEWLDDSLPRQAPRRLKKAARATNASRDADVRLVWLREQRPTMNTNERPGLNWMLKRISEHRAESFKADVKKGARAFDKANRQLDQGLREYRVRIDKANEDSAQLFDAVLGGLMRDQTTDLSRRLSAVHTISNARQIHAARISAKRLRYLIDPVADLVPGVKELVDELGKLQDALGDSHDASLFAEELQKISANDADDTRLAPGLVALSQRLQTHTEKVFSEVKRWLDGDARQLLDRVYIIADALAPARLRRLELVRENSTA
ncbi:MAG TPA: CHAD domain-containing protein [Gemmatimonadaceae bacterium]